MIIVTPNANAKPERVSRAIGLSVLLLALTLTAKIALHRMPLIASSLQGRGSSVQIPI
jgi:hypothetical protein